MMTSLGCEIRGFVCRFTGNVKFGHDFGHLSTAQSIWNVQFGPLRLYMMSVIVSSQSRSLELIPQTKQVKYSPNENMRANGAIAKPEATD
jgi:hypothetical protein